MRGTLCCCADVLDVGRCHRHAEGTSATAYCDDVVIATDYDGSISKAWRMKVK